MARRDILLAGNYCHDTLVNPAGAFEALGGSAAYASAVLDALGADFSVVAKVGEDFRYADAVLRPALRVPGPTTRFLDDYSAGPRHRVSVLKARCEPIRPEDIKESAEVAVAGAVAGELPPETLLALKKRCRYLLCDVQGLVRTFDAQGRVGHVALKNTPFAALLPQIDFLTTSREELEFLDLGDVRRQTRVLITEDEEGCRLFEGGKELRLPAYPVKVQDSTGAGDSFLAGFAFGLAKGWDAVRAARFGNFCGALAVSQLGIPKLKAADFDAFYAESIP